MASPWESAGTSAGVEVWRVEKLDLRKLPSTEVGIFYEGDSYVVLHTSASFEGSDLQHSVYFWLGAATSQDEWGTAAISAVQLDDHLGGHPVQRREVQGAESNEFLSIFPRFTVKKGGVESGFSHVKVESHKTRLLRVAGRVKKVQLYEHPIDVRHLNNHDVFILDAGHHIFQYNAPSCNVWEKRKACEVVDSLQNARQLPNTATSIIDGPDDPSAEKFWMHFGGKQPIPDTPPTQGPEERTTQVYTLSDDFESFDGPHDASMDMLRPSAALLVDATYGLFVWGGFDIDVALLKQQYLKVCEKYIATQPTRTLRTTPIGLCFQGHENDDFVGLFA